MEAVLKIYGDIGEPDPAMEILDGIEVFSAKAVDEFINANKDADSLTIRINSRGGDVQEGWLIHDLLLNSGKPIKTIAEGKVYSIATILFLAGSEREIMQNADGQIHNPYIPPYTLADKYESADLQKIADALKDEEAKILDFYVNQTGADESKLAELMKEDTKLSAEDMLELGFATKIIEPIKAYAYFNTKNKFIMDKAEVKTFGQKLDTILDRIKGLSRVETIDQTLKDKDGNEFKLDKESGSPAVGDSASPDGTYVMEGGKTITIADGKVSNVKDEDPVEGKTDLEIANEKITALEAERDEANDKVTALEDEKPDLIALETEAKGKLTEAQGIATDLKALQNKWKPEGRTNFSSADKVGDVDMNRVRELNKKLAETESKS